jgi:hypothetical protein
MSWYTITRIILLFNHQKIGAILWGHILGATPKYIIILYTSDHNTKDMPTFCPHYMQRRKLPVGTTVLKLDDQVLQDGMAD